MAEGENRYPVGGVAAHDYRFRFVAAVVALGGMMYDQLLYLLGRCCGGKFILRRFPRYHTKIRRAQKNDPTPSVACL